MFLFFNDPEGPNLFVVIGMAAIVYFLSLAACISLFNHPNLKKILSTILIQIIIVISFYFCLN